MTAPGAIEIKPKRRPWLVRMQYRMRFSAISLLLVAASMDMFGKNRSQTDWMLLAVLMLSYPHIQYWRTCRAADALKAEIDHLAVDAVVIGVLVAASGFSLWLSLTAVLGVFMDNVTNKGWATLLETSLGLLAGALAWIVLRGWNPAFATSMPVALFCFCGMSAYLLVMSNNGYRRQLQMRRARENLTARETELVKLNATLVAELQENAALHSQLLEQTNRDPLTGLYNRRYLQLVLDMHMSRSQRDGSALAFIMIDIDHFKAFNDCYGHQAGDYCLRRVAQQLQAGIQRTSDLVARYGGEEFLVVLPNTNDEKALALANALRQAVMELNIGHQQSSFGKVTISVGLAVMNHNSYADAAGLLRAADTALYQAKNNGRNQVRTAAIRPASADP